MESEKLEQVWRAVCDQVKSYNNIDPSQINAFFSRLQPQAMSEDFLMLTADNDFIKTWIERHYVDFIKQALMDLYRTAFTVLIEVDIAAEAAGAAQGTVASAGRAFVGDDGAGRGTGRCCRRSTCRRRRLHGRGAYGLPTPLPADGGRTTAHRLPDRRRLRAGRRRCPGRRLPRRR